MSAEKSDAIIIRQTDFSESSRVITLFTRDFGKVSCMAKGAKRLKGPFESSLDMLARCRVVFLHRHTGSLNLLTEAQLIARFKPADRSLTHLYGGYYVAELLNALTEEDDPHPDLYDAAAATLDALANPAPLFLPITHFELSALREIGQIPNFDTCTICHSAIPEGAPSRFWVSQGGLICSDCGHSDYQTSEIQPGSLSVLRHLASETGSSYEHIAVTDRQRHEVRKLVASTVSHVLGKRPKTLSLLNF